MLDASGATVVTQDSFSKADNYLEEIEPNCTCALCYIHNVCQSFSRLELFVHQKTSTTTASFVLYSASLGRACIARALHFARAAGRDPVLGEEAGHCHYMSRSPARSQTTPTPDEIRRSIVH
jgi:hypothetical protein